MAMRAGGLLAGGGLLVVSWIAWFVVSGPLPGSAGRDRLLAQERGLAVVEAGAVEPAGVPAIPIYAAIRGGPALAQFLAGRGVAGRLTVIASADHPALVGLTAQSCAGVAFRTLDVPAWGEGRAKAGREAGDGLLGTLPVPFESTWVALFADQHLLGACRVSLDRELVRFEFSAEELFALLKCPLES
jgi:hypothetical protein